MTTPANSSGPDLPARMYSGPDATGGNAPRSDEFATGVSGVTEPSALNQASIRFNSQVPTGYRPMSLLTPVMRRSANGMSADQAARRFPDGTPIGNPNGIAADQLEQSVLMRMGATGQNTQ